MSLRRGEHAPKHLYRRLTHAKGVREPLRIRACWVPDQMIKQLEAFLAGPGTHDARVLALSTSSGSTHGGPA